MLLGFYYISPKSVIIRVPYPPLLTIPLSNRRYSCLSTAFPAARSPPALCEFRERSPVYRQLKKGAEETGGVGAASAGEGGRKS